MDRAAAEIPFPAELPNVLIVEEEEAIRKFLGTFLRELGCTVASAGGGQEGLDLFRRHQDNIALVFLDVGMQGWDGPRTLEALQAVKPSVQVCFMTGNGGKYTQERLLAMGAMRVLHKPFGYNDVKNVAEKAGVVPERRSSPRLFAKRLKISAHAPGSRAIPETWVRDYSSGGLGLWVDQRVDVGTVLELKTPAEATPHWDPTARIEVRHCRPEQHGWFVGCRFLPQEFAN